MGHNNKKQTWRKNTCWKSHMHTFTVAGKVQNKRQITLDLKWAVVKHIVLLMKASSLILLLKLKCPAHLKPWNGSAFNFWHSFHAALQNESCIVTITVSFAGLQTHKAAVEVPANSYNWTDMLHRWLAKQSLTHDANCRRSVFEVQRFFCFASWCSLLFVHR